MATAQASTPHHARKRAVRSVFGPSLTDIRVAMGR